MSVDALSTICQQCSNTCHTGYWPIAAINLAKSVTIQRVSLEGRSNTHYRVGATLTSRFEAFGRDVGVVPTRHFHSKQLMLNSYQKVKLIRPFVAF